MFAAGAKLRSYNGDFSQGEQEKRIYLYSSRVGGHAGLFSPGNLIYLNGASSKRALASCIITQNMYENSLNVEQHSSVISDAERKTPSTN